MERVQLLNEFQKNMAFSVESRTNEGAHMYKAIIFDFDYTLGDFTTHQFRKKYDLVMSFGTLHFVNKDDWKQFIIRAKDGEIKELYEDWEILQFKAYVFEDEHPGVPKHLHASNKIVAKKKA